MLPLNHMIIATTGQSKDPTVFYPTWSAAQGTVPWIGLDYSRDTEAISVSQVVSTCDTIGLEYARVSEAITVTQQKLMPTIGLSNSRATETISVTQQPLIPPLGLAFS